MREDRSVLDLLKSDHTWLNERLAKHYGIPNVYGPRFRQISVAGVADPGGAAGVGDPGYSARGGILRHASVLTVTSYATRTSPVLRGKWVLENLLGTPPPPPPPNVPPLKENGVGKVLSMRERMEQHRSNPACSGCHSLMDPIGLSIEN